MIVETINGEIFRSGRIEALWEPPDTLPSDAELEAKFLWLTTPVIGKTKAERLIETIRTLDELPSMESIFKGSRSDSRPE